VVVNEQMDLLLGFVRATARHSGLRGDTLTSLFVAASACLEAGTGASQVGFDAAPLVGEDLLVAHEIGLLAAAAESGLSTASPGAADAAAAMPDGTSTDRAFVDERGIVWVQLLGVAGPLGALRLTPPPGGWDDAAGALAFAAAVGDELAATVLRHWAERQHLDRSAALLEAQRHTHVGCFEWDIVADKVRWSDELFRIFGDEPQAFEPTFEEFLERIHEDDRDAVRASVYEAYEGRRDYQIEERIIRPDGSVRQLASWGHVIVDDQTVPVKIIGSCQDVTEFRAAMHTLAATERQLAEGHERRTRALELNDNVVQGLVTSLYALELGQADNATTALSGTLRSARSIIGDLLMTSGDDLDAVALVRSAPAHSYLESTPLAPPAPPPASDAQPIRVIIADDSSDIRLLTSLILSAEADFEVVAEAADGAEAVVRARAHQPDMVLLDLAMPVLDGFAAIPQIRTASPGTMIVVFSGFNAASAADEAIALGAHAYVEKGLIDVPLPHRLREIRRRITTDPRPSPAPTASST
jgi:PAS domain S-box-containing protein